VIAADVQGTMELSIVCLRVCVLTRREIAVYFKLSNLGKVEARDG
jgi:hypothetical protein